MTKKFWAVATAFVAVATLSAGCTPTTVKVVPLPTGAYGINPCNTQLAIQCTPNADAGHIVAPPNPGVTPKNKLAILLNDIAAPATSQNKLGDILVGDGFHLISLVYRNSFIDTTSCPDASAVADPDCHRRFRHEVNFGGGTPDPLGAVRDHSGIIVSPENSTENRILRLVQWLVTNQSTEGWEQFQFSNAGVCTSPNPVYVRDAGTCNLDWSKIVLVGSGLGAGHALYLSKFHPVDRVVMISGPFDEYVAPSLTVAPWITELGFATPATSMYGFTHTVEANHANQSAAWAALGVPGPQVSIDGGTPPYGLSHQLTTTAPAGCIFPGSAHFMTSQDSCTPGVFPNFAAVWQYMAAG